MKSSEVNGKRTKWTSELQRSIPGISQKVLIQQLRELEQDGIIGRPVYSQMPPKVEYYITEYGITANEIINQMCTWGRTDIERRQQQGEEVELVENES